MSELLEGEKKKNSKRAMLKGNKQKLEPKKQNITR